MCGICLIGGSTSNQACPQHDLQSIKNRGPDSFASVDVNINNNSTTLTFSASVLSLQRDASAADRVVLMPYQIAGSTSLLLWNGEIFCGGGGAAVSTNVTISDTHFVADALFNLEMSATSLEKFTADVCRFARSIGGPFSFIYLAATTKVFPPTVICGRDFWGRRSLVLGKSATGGGGFALCSTVLPRLDSSSAAAATAAASALRQSLPSHMFSDGGSDANDEDGNEEPDDKKDQQPQRPENSADATAAAAASASSASVASHLSPGYTWEEVAPDGIYVLKLKLPSETTTVISSASLELVARFVDLAPMDLNCGRASLSDSSNSSLSCVRLHPLADEARFSTHRVPMPVGVALATACEEQDAASCVHRRFIDMMDRLHSSVSSNSLLEATKVLERWFGENCNFPGAAPESANELKRALPRVFASFLQRASRTTTTNQIEVTCALAYMAALATSVQRRTASWNTHSKPRCDNASSQTTSSSSSSPILVLFSGGIDCLVLAKLTHLLRPELPLDLVNVAFGSDAADCMAASDRISCLEAFERGILSTQQATGTSIATSTTPRLLLCDVAGEQVLADAASIARCVLPRNTVMDTCIGSAIWYASRGVGRPACFRPQQEDLNDNAEARVATATTARFQPLLDCIVSHYVDRGEDDLSICLLGKEYNSSELQAAILPDKKSIRVHCEAAQTAGLVKVRWVTRTIAQAADGDDEQLPAVRERGQDGKKKPGTVLPQFQTMRDYLVSLTDAAAIAKAQRLRAARFRTASLVVSQTAPTVQPAVPNVKSEARVVLAGMGADESLGGYARYTRQDFAANPNAGTNQMQLDFDRLWQRNLGRDDRCISDNGKEGRFPFLDENVLFTLSGIVSWLQEERQQQSTTSAGFVASTLFKDKRLLRLGAELVLGLPTELTMRPKKAIQFGTKIANRKNKGESVCL